MKNAFDITIGDLTRSLGQLTMMQAVTRRTRSPGGLHASTNNDEREARIDLDDEFDKSERPR